MPSAARTARELIAFSLDLRRVLRHLLADEEPAEALSWAQSELLHDVRSHPGTTVNDSAGRLHLASNTVSTLVRGLVERGLLERAPNPADRRSVLLHVGAERAERRARRDDAREARVARALRSISPQELAILAEATPVLARVVGELGAEEMSESTARTRAAMSDQDRRGAHSSSATR